MIPYDSESKEHVLPSKITTDHTRIFTGFESIERGCCDVAGAARGASASGFRLLCSGNGGCVRFYPKELARALHYAPNKMRCTPTGLATAHRKGARFVEFPGPYFKF